LLSKPLLIFDGDCGFCKKWVNYASKLTKDSVYYKAYQTVDLKKLQLSAEACKQHVVLIEPNNTRYTAARAVFKTLSYSKTLLVGLIKLYTYLPGFKWLTETVYKWVASNRSKLAFLSPPATYTKAASLLTTGVFFVYALAYLSLFSQSLGLFGSHGIVSIADTVSIYAEQKLSFWQVPSLFYVFNSDLVIKWLPLLNVFIALGAIRYRYKWIASLWLWLCYVSFINVGSPFMSFQWDVLLTEAGFLHILLCLWPGRLVMLGFQWLVFKLMLASALIKWGSGDALWRSFDALSVHFYTQPLPFIISWYANQLPTPILKFGIGFMFFVEFACPWLLFFGRIPRLFAAICFMLLMTLIFFTGNYGFFNILVGILAISYIDDSFLKLKDKPLKQPKKLIQVGIALLIAVFILVGISSERQRFTSYRLGSVESVVLKYQQPWHIVNGYGLFANMTTKRDEIKIEGSYDKETWQAYTFKFKPSDPDTAPQWVAPHQPRLDWQMWFASLSSYKQNYWLVNTMARLAKNEQDVINLLAHNPFDKKPPTYIRAMRYNTVFTDLKTKQKMGHWWHQTLSDAYTPILQVRE